MARVDIAILREIVRVISTRSEVPEFVDLNKKRFQVTYLEDHKQRIEEALRRNDRDRLNMLYGQLESKVKYQLLRSAGSGRAGDAPTAARKKATAPTKTAAKAVVKAAAKSAKAAGKAAKTVKTAPKAAKATKKVATRSPSKKKK